MIYKVLITPVPEQTSGGSPYLARVSVRKHCDDDIYKAVWNKYKLNILSRNITEFNQFVKNVPLGRSIPNMSKLTCLQLHSSISSSD